MTNKEIRRNNRRLTCCRLTYRNFQNELSKIEYAICENKNKFLKACKQRRKEKALVLAKSILSKWQVT